MDPATPFFVFATAIVLLYAGGRWRPSRGWLTFEPWRRPRRALVLGAAALVGLTLVAVAVRPDALAAALPLACGGALMIRGAIQLDPPHGFAWGLIGAVMLVGAFAVAGW